MKSKPYAYAAAALAAIGLWGFTPGTQAAIEDLTGGATVNFNGAIFTTVNSSFQPAGTGVIQPFVRLDANDNEAGYNTSLGTPLQVLANSWHLDLLLSSLKPVSYTFQGQTQTYYDFRLDLNQSSGGSHPLLSLNQVQIFALNAAAPTTWTENATTGRVINGLTPLYDMNSAAAPTANGVTLSYDLYSGGSGIGDMALLVPTSAFAGLSPDSTYIVLYSQFGTPPGANPTNDGFEEWAAVVVPEPSTIAAAVLLLLPFGASTLRLLGKNRNAVA